jgi:hypothetical protein
MIKFHEQFDYVLSEVLNVSGNSVAKSIGAHQGLVNRYRKGLTAPPVEFAQKFCEHYGISANWLLLNIEPIMMNDIKIDQASQNRFSKELQKKNQLKSDLMNLKKTITEICDNNL